MKLSVILALSLVYFQITFSQPKAQRAIDSLHTELASADQLKDQHRLMMQLSAVFMSISLDSTMYHSRNAYNLAMSNSMQLEAAQALGYISYAFLYKGKRDSAEKYFLQMRDGFVSIKDTLGIVQAELNLASIEYYRGDYPKAIELSLNALRLSELQENQENNQSSILNNLAIYHEAMEDNQNALDYYRKSLVLKRKFEVPRSISRTLNNIGRLFLFIEEYDSSRVYLKEALAMRRHYNDAAGIASSQRSLAMLKNELGQYQECLNLLREVIEIDIKLGDQRNLIADYNLKGKAYMGLNNLKDAEKWGKQSLKLSKELNASHDEMDNLVLLAQLAEKRKSWKQALDYWTASRAIKDSIASQERKEEIDRLETLYETEKKDKEILSLTQEKTIQALKLGQRSRQLLFAGILAVLLLLVAILVYSRYRLKEQSEQLMAVKNEELRSLNASKDKLFSIVAHDLRNPLSAFQQISATLEKKIEVLDKSEIQYFVGKIHRSSNQLYDLLQNLLQWAGSQSGRLRFEPQNLTLDEHWERVKSGLQQDIENRGIRIEEDFSDREWVYADPDMLEIILRNLLSNAIKFSPKEGKVSIKTRGAEDGAWIIIEDNGIGLSEEEAQRLFDGKTDPSSIGDHPEKGTGLGLLLCRDLMKRHGGNIKASPASSGGAKFVLTFLHPL